MFICHMAREDPLVTVKQGRLRGIVEENVYGGQFLAFRGIPFAKPPTGPLRFKVNTHVLRRPISSCLIFLPRKIILD